MIDLAQLAGLDDILYHLHIRIVSGLEADRDDFAALLLSLSYLDSLVESHAHRFFKQDIHAVLKGIDSTLGMGHVICTDADRIELLIVDKLLVAAVHPDALRGVPLFEELLRLAGN